MKGHRLVGTLVLVLLICGLGLANPTWDGGGPQTGTKQGEIDVTVTYTVPVGWVTTGDVVIMCCPKWR